MFADIGTRGVDGLMALMQTFREDERPQKVDLVVGVYKDEQGNVPIMRSVKSAESHILQQEVTKNYVGITGDAEFRDLVPHLLLGSDASQIADGRFASLQTPGGSGALKVACDFLNSIETGKTIWVSTPTWANHIPVATDAGLTVEQYPYFRPSDYGLNFDAMMSHLNSNARSGDVILLHACCHNPTGVDLSFDQWKTVTEFVIERGLLPLVDSAYQGLAKGMNEDAAGMRHMASLVPEMLIANSFSKNFGIYRERTGALSVLANTAQDLAAVISTLQTVVRSNYSMPPSHGARIVATVLNNDELTQSWETELEEMRNRIASMRRELMQKLQQRNAPFDPSFLTNQTGMFSYTGFSSEIVKRLKDEFAIYIAGDGRINVAGLCQANLDTVAAGFALATSSSNS